MGRLHDLDRSGGHRMPVACDHEPVAGSTGAGPGLLEGGRHAGRGLACAENDGPPLRLFRQAAIELFIRQRRFQGSFKQGVEDFAVIRHAATLRQKSCP
jgi:hypothetical protein